jgi:hypothetical protein
LASVEAALKTLLTTGSPNPVAAAVGTRVYYDELPQGVTYPAIRLQRISTIRSPYRTLDGRANYARPRFQIDVYSPTKTEALNLAQAIYDLLEGYRGTPTGLPTSWRIDAISTEDEGGSLEELGLYRQRLDIFVMHSEI